LIAALSVFVGVGMVDRRSTLKATRELASSHLITSCAALAALILFIPIGQRIVAASFDHSASAPIDGQLAVAFLLNIAVILFAWRRSKDLQAALVASELAQQTAHDNAFVDHVTGLANRRELMRVLSDPTPAAPEARSSFSTSTSSRRSTIFMATSSATKC
jgi:hypothetical protein